MRDFLVIVGGRVLTAIVTLIGIRWVTILLSVEQYGFLNLLISFQVFCGLFLVNPVGQHINRHTHQWLDEGSMLSRLVIYRRYIVLVGLVGVLVCLAWIQGQTISLTEKFLYSIMVGLMVVAATWNATYIPLLNMMGLRSASVAWGAFTIIIALLFSLILTYIYPVALSWFTGQMLGFGLGAWVASRQFQQHLLPTSQQGKWPLVDKQSVWHYCVPLAIATGFMWVQLSGYRFVLAHYWGLSALGFAMVGLVLANQLWGLLESLLMQFVLPLFFKRISAASNSQGAEAFSDLLAALGPIYIVLAAATILASSALLALFIDPRYANAHSFVALGALIECCRVLGNLLSNAAQISRKMKALILPYASGAVVIVLSLIWFGEHHYSIDAAIVSVVFGGLAMLLVMLWRMKKELSFTLLNWRWLVALLSLIIAIAAMELELLPKVLMPLDALIYVVCVGAASLLLLGGLLWKNPALQRLLAVKLMET